MSYYIIYPLLYLFSLLPFFVLYGIANGFYGLVFYVFKYRRKIVQQNLKKSFPNYTEEELKKVEKQFYKHLRDLFVETIKAISISRNHLLNRVTFTNKFIELFDAYYEKKQGVVVVLGHTGNWEWTCLAFSARFKQEVDGLYHPISNKGFDKLMYNLRSRFGVTLVDMHVLPRALPGIKKKVTALALIADQTPSHANAYWTNFLNQDTPVFFGTERVAKKLNWPVIYVSAKKIKRGYYDLDACVISEQPNLEKEGLITELHTRELEKDIQSQPAVWLWSHRRWKKTRVVTND